MISPILIRAHVKALAVPLLMTGAILLVVGLIFTFGPKHSLAATGTNPQLNFQGRLLDSTGAVVADGDYNMEFTIVQDGDGCNPTSGTYPCSGTVKWTETRKQTDRVTVKNGYFSVNLGSVTAFGSSVDWNQDTLWLGINVGGTTNTPTPTWDGVMKPMKRLTSSPYAFNSAALQGLTAGNFVQLAQGVQTDSSTTNPSIFINKTGATANILELQKSGADKLILDNNGLLTLNNNSSTGLVVNNSSSSKTVLAVDTSANKLVLGQAGASGLDGLLQFNNAAGSNTVSLQLGANPGSSYTLLLPTTGPSTSQCLQTDPSTANQLVFDSCGAGGSGDNISVNGSAATDANFIDTTGTGTVTGLTWTLNTGPSPDTLQLSVANASDTVAGAITTGAQNIAGDKTYFGNILANGTATGTNTTTTNSGTNGTSINLTSGVFSNNDVIFINNAGQDFYTRVTAGGGTTTITVSPAVSWDNGATVTKYTVQNIGASASDYTTQGLRFYQGYFLGGIVTGAGSTTLSDQNLTSSGALYLNTGSNGDLTLAPNGSGNVVVSGDSNTGLIFNGSTTDITTSDTNGSLTLSANGSGNVVVSGDSDTGLVISGATTSISTGSNGNLTIVPNGSGSTVFTIDTDTNVQISGTLAPSAGGTQQPLSLSITNAPTSTANTLNGLSLAITDATSLANTIRGLSVDLSNVSNSAATATAALFNAGSVLQTTNGPRFQGGVDSSSTATGTSSLAMNRSVSLGKYLYVVKNSSVTNCNTAGDKSGCEIQVYDVSNPSSPTFLNGNDISGTLNSGTAAGSATSVALAGNYLYVTTGGTGSTCSSSTATGCELQVYSISNPAKPSYLGGADASSTTNTGSSTDSFNDIYISGRYAYVAKTNNVASSCSSVPGSCELQVYDISNPSLPTYLGGVDADGTNSGSIQGTFNSVVVSGPYAYVAKTNGSSTCNSGAGARHCELQIYDITNPANITFVAGLDASGQKNAGTINLDFNQLRISGKYLYVAKNNDSFGCSNTSGSGRGCEVQIYDISDPTNPSYVAGVDSSGTTGSGSGNQADKYVSIAGRYMYITVTGNTGTCSQTAGSAIGCEVQVYDLSNPASPSYVGGADNAGQTNSTGSNSVNVNSTYVLGRNVYIMSNGSATACSQTTGSAIGCELQVYDGTGFEGTSVTAGSLDSGILNVRQDALVYNNLSVGNGLAVGQGGIISQGGLNIVASSGQLYDLATVTNSGSASTVNGVDGLVLNFSTSNASGDALHITPSFTTNTNATYNGIELDAFTATQSSGTAAVNGLKVGNLTESGSLTSVALNIGSGWDNGLSSLSSGLFKLDSTTAFQIQKAAGSNAFTVDTTKGIVTQPFLQASYVGGADATSTANSGSGNSGFNATYISGPYLYAVKNGSATTCAGSSGSFIGCELQIYNIANPTSPTYLGGADASGSSNTGTGNSDFYSIYARGSYVYITKKSDTTACSQSAGSAVGCEVQVYNVSNPTSPTYVGGADTSGSTNSGTGGTDTLYVTGSGKNIYVTQKNSTSTCSVTAGSADGCELKTFDISNPSRPTYLGGADAGGATNSGSAGTNGGQNMTSVAVNGRYAFVSQATTISDSTACSQTPGSAIGCELKVFDVSNPTTPTYIGGADISGSTNSGTSFQNFRQLVMSGNYVFLGGGNNGSSGCSSVAGSAEYCELQIYNVSNPASPTYVAGMDLDGSTSGNNFAQDFKSLYVSGRYLYVTQDASGSTCSTGNGLGCELKVFDVSNPASPSFLGGADSSGSSNTGSGSSVNFLNVQVYGRYAYVVSSGSGTACSQSVGSAIGCELQVYDISGVDATSLLTGSLESGILSVRQDALVYNNLNIGNSLTVGLGGIASQGGLSVTVASAPGTDIVQISNAGNSSTTAGVDGIALSFGSTNADGDAFHITPSFTTNATATYNGIELDAFTATQSAGTATVNGLKIGNLTESGTVTSAALNIGTGWDNSILGAGALTITTGSSNTALTLNNGSTGDIQFFSSSYKITSAGALTVASCSGCGGSSAFTSSSGTISQTTSTDQLNLIEGQAGDYGLKVSTSVAPTVDLVQITNTGNSSVTDGVDGLAITLDVSNASGSALHLLPSYSGGATDLNQYAAISIEGFSPSNSSGTDSVFGALIGAIGDPGSTIDSRAVQINAGWDIGVSIFNATTGISVYATTDITSSDTNGDLKITANGSGNVIVGGDSDTGLLISGATTDITTNSGEDLTITANGSGNVVIGGDSDTGLKISGATTDITTGTNEDLTISANGSGNVAISGDSDTGLIVTSTSSTALAVGRQGATSPALQIDASTASSVTGLKVKAAAAGGGLALSTVGGNTDENLTLDAKGAGTVTINGTATGAITLSRNSSVSGTLTVTSSNASALAVGRQGSTSPALQVDASTGSSVTGLKVKAAAAGGGLALSLVGGNTDENLTLDAKGAGTLTLQSTATGDIQFFGSSYKITSAGALTVASCSGCGGLTTVAYSSSSNANGGSISGNTLTLYKADTSNPGLLSADDQSIAGTKTFSLAAGKQLIASASAANTLDLAKISNSGQASTTDAKSGLLVEYGTSNVGGNGIRITPSFTTNATATYDGIKLDAFTATQSAGTATVNGVDIGTLTESGSVASTGLKVGSGWDNGLTTLSPVLIKVDSALAFDVQDSGGHDSLVFDSTSNTLKVYEDATSPSNYASISATASDATFKSNSGTTKIGSGSGSISVLAGSGAGITITGNAASNYTTTAGGLTFTGAAASNYTTSAGALTLTGAAASTWSTAAGDLTIQGGSGTVSLGSSTILTANAGLTISTASNGALTLAPNGSGGINLTTGTGSQTHSSSVVTGTGATSAFVFSDTSLTSGTAIKVTSANPQVNANSGVLTSAKLIDVSSTNHTYLSADNRDLMIGGHRNNFSGPGSTNEIFTYDTASDSDGGRWTNDERAQNSSWYNETKDNTGAACVINTDDRCGASAFPRKALIAVQDSHVYIFDAKDNSLWMTFNQGSGTTIFGTDANNNPTDVWAQNGMIFVGTGGSAATGLYILDFIHDRATRINATDALDYASNLSARNSSATILSQSRGTNYGLKLTTTGTPTVNDVKSNIVNGKLYIAVALGAAADTTTQLTAGNAVLIDWTDQSEAFFTATAATFQSKQVFLTPSGNLYWTNGASASPTNFFLKEKYNAVTASGSNNAPDVIWGNTSSSNYGTSITDGATPTFTAGPAPVDSTTVSNGLWATPNGSLADGNSDVVYWGTSDNMTVINTKKGSETGGSVKYYNKDYITDDLYGDIRGFAPFNGSGSIANNTNFTGATVKANAFTFKNANGTGMTYGSGVRGTAITALDNTDDYVCTGTTGTCADDNDFDPPSGSSLFSFGAWVKRSATGTDTDTIIAKWGNASANQAYRLYFTSGDAPSCDQANGSGTTQTATGIALTDTSNWHYITCVYDINAARLKLYVDGIKVASTTDSNTTATAGAVAYTIGADLSGGSNAAANFFRGAIDEPFVTMTNLSDGQINHAFQVGNRALNGHGSQTIRGANVAADASQQLNGSSSQVNSIGVDPEKELVYVGTNGGGVSAIGLYSDTINDLFTTSATDDTGTAMGSNTINHVFVAKGYGAGSLFVGIAHASGIWIETGDTNIKDTFASSFNPFGLTLDQSNLTVDQVFRVTNSLGSRMDNMTLGGSGTTSGVIMPQVYDLVRVDANGLTVAPGSATLGTTELKGTDIFGNTNFSVKAMGANFGGYASTGAFEGKNTYFGDDFMIGNSATSGTTTCAGTATQGNFGWNIGDYGSHARTTGATCASANSGAGEFHFSGKLGATTANQDCQSAYQSTTNGVERLQSRSTVTASNNATCMLILGGTSATTSNKILVPANLPIMTAKVKMSTLTSSNTARFRVGMSDSDSVSSVALGVAPANGIYFSNCATDSTTSGSIATCSNTTWYGHTFTSSTDRSVTCSVGSGSITANFAYLRIEVRSTTDIHFFADYNTSDGINESECGTGIAVGPSANMAPFAISASATNAAETVAGDIDYLRTWQDDNVSTTNEPATAPDGTDLESDSPLTFNAPGSDALDNRIDPFSTIPEFVASTSEDATFEHNVYVHGTLYADKVKANQIEGLEVITDKISSLSDKLAKNSAGSSTGTVLSASAGGSSNIDTANLSVQSARIALDLTVMGNLIANGSLTVHGDASFLGNVSFGGHISTSGDPPQIKYAELDGLTGSAQSTSKANGNDISGELSIDLNENPVMGKLITLSFKKSYSKAPRILLTPENEGSAGTQYFVRSDANGFTITVTGGQLNPNDNLLFNYLVIQ